MTRTALVVVHPKSALDGSARKISAQWTLIDEWDGSVFILDDHREISSPSATANTYLEIIDVVIDERESVGQETRIKSGPGAAALSQACEQLTKLHPHGNFLLTGFAGDIDDVLRRLVNAGRTARIHETAVRKSR